MGTHAGRIDLHGFVDDVTGSLGHHQHREGRDKLVHLGRLQRSKGLKGLNQFYILISQNKSQQE